MEMRRSNSLGEVEPKDLKKYKQATKKQCPQCGKSVLFVKQTDAQATVLECPNCDLIQHLPYGMDKYGDL